MYIRMTHFLAGMMAMSGILFFAAPATAQSTLTAGKTDKPITLDGNADEWKDIDGVTVALTAQGEGTGNVASVELKAAIRGDMIYILAVWEDSEENTLHKPYVWNDSLQSYEASSDGEDRFIVTIEKSGNFSANKMDGSEFEADVWYWKSSRSNPLGLAHDKWWRVSAEEFKKGKKYATANGDMYVRRSSDKGDRLYKSVKYDTREGDVMPRYVVAEAPTGSITDVKASGVWKDGRWYLELARKLDTGNKDDAAIPASGSIKIAVAASSGTSGGLHSTSDVIVLKTGK